MWGRPLGVCVCVVVKVWLGGCQVSGVEEKEILEKGLVMEMRGEER